MEANAGVALARAPEVIPGDACTAPIPDQPEEMTSDLAPALASLKPLGQIRESFILAVNHEGLWIVDQHVAHERVLFERVLRQRAAQEVESQRLLMPLILELTPAQQAVFTEISDELAGNGFEVVHTLTRSQPPGWTGYSRRIDPELLADVAWPASESPRVYVCGSTRFVDAAADGLLQLGYDARWIRTERFGATG